MAKKLKNQKNKVTPANLFSNLAFLLNRIFRYEKMMFFCDILAGIIDGVTLFFGPFVVKYVLDQLALGTAFQAIFINIIFMCLGVAAINIIREILVENSWWRAVRLRFKVIIEKNEKILNMDYQLLENPDTQNIIEKANNAVSGNWNGFEGMYNNGVEFLKNIWPILIAILMTVTFITSVSLWIILGVVAVLLITKFIAQNHVYKLDKTKFWDVIPEYRRKLRYITSISRNKEIAKDLRIYNMKDFIEKNQTEVQNTVHGYLRGSQNRKLKLNGLLQFLMIIQEGVLYGFLIKEVIDGHLSIADFTLMLSSVRILAGRLTNLFKVNNYLLSCARQVTDLRDFMKLADGEVIKTKLVPKSDNYVIEFKNVYFRYYSQEDYALENISFKLNPQEKIALVGYNGAGKTTLIKLLCGLYHPEKGEILINGVNISEYNANSYYQLIAPVFQDVNYYAFDIAENIAMEYKKSVDYQKASEALMIAGLAEKINSLPNGIKTTLQKDLDEKGTELSGGEAQKLSLARAIYKQAPIVILDEPTSALDAIAEYQMYVNFNQIIHNQSAIYISHRLSSTRFCDRILMLKDGKIIEEGTHQQLMDLNGEYKEVFSIQAQYYQDEVLPDE